MSFLIRVQLPDTPGSLGELAEAIGVVDGNIKSVDIVENAPDGTVTDDIVVELPIGTLADALITAASTVKGVEVDSIRPSLAALTAVDRSAFCLLLRKSPTTYRPQWNS